jgi:hypothetical protein
LALGDSLFHKYHYILILIEQTIRFYII